MTVFSPGDEQVLALTHARPDDDQPRAVLADMLMDRGDPRGAFIALQLEYARAPSLSLKVRMNVLRRDQGRAWLPPGVRCPTAVCRRGFLAEAECFGPTDPAHPEWPLVEGLTPGA